MSTEFPGNDLERALVAAIRQTSPWGAFFRALRGSQVVVVHDPPRDGGPDPKNAQGVPEQLRLRLDPAEDQPHVVVFTSTDVCIAAAGDAVERYRMNAPALLGLMAGTAMSVNPSHEFGVLLPADLVAAIADESIFEDPDLRQIPPDPESIRIDRPPHHLDHLTGPAETALRAFPEAMTAHLAWWTETGHEDGAHAVIGFCARAKWDEIAVACDQAIRAASDTLDQVDFLPMGPDGTSHWPEIGQRIMDVGLEIYRAQ